MLLIAKPLSATRLKISFASPASQNKRLRLPRHCNPNITLNISARLVPSPTTGLQVRRARRLTTVNATVPAAANPEQPLSTSSSPSTLSDTWLGNLFLQLLPGWTTYSISFLMPTVTLLAAAGAIWGPTLLATAASLPLIKSVHPLSSALFTLGAHQTWSAISSFTLSALAVLYAFILMPVLDFLLGKEIRNPSPTEEVAAMSSTQTKSHHADNYRRVLHAYVIVHLVTLTTVCHLVCTHAVPLVSLLGVAVSTGVAHGIGFTVAHELLHSPAKIDRFLSCALLAPTAYLFWTESHLAHHVKVATPEDPSSARFGESLWAFIPRSIFGNIVDGFAAEAHRRQRKNVPFWSVDNRAVWWVGIPSALATGAFVVWGFKGLLFYVVQAIVGVLMLETVNYIEHYGLTRKKLPEKNNKYERVMPWHSWNATTVFTNSAAFKLQRHADHHAFERRPYHLLRDLPQAPQLPGGYPAMMLLATLPPVWFAVMNPCVEKAKADRLEIEKNASEGEGECLTA